MIRKRTAERNAFIARMDALVARMAALQAEQGVKLNDAHQI
jgi:hypothetical protein